MTAELRLTESQGLEIGKLIYKLNKDGCITTASLFGDILRISATEKEIELLKKALQNLPRWEFGSDSYLT